MSQSVQGPPASLDEDCVSLGLYGGLEDGKIHINRHEGQKLLDDNKHSSTALNTTA